VQDIFIVDTIVKLVYQFYAINYEYKSYSRGSLLLSLSLSLSLSKKHTRTYYGTEEGGEWREGLEKEVIEFPL
jgi:hypothetical protein